MRYLPSARTPSARKRSRFIPRLEVLESRINPYVLSGGAWVNPQLITISFVPDGTVLGYDGQGHALTSTMFHDFAALGSTTTWQNQILKSAQVWAQQTNVNFAVVSDSGADIGSGNYEQGDSTFGDIRIGGYQQGSGSSYPLASAAMPPQLNNYSIGGDITFNTSQAFNIGSTYDLFTVSAHEVGHALGMDHSLDTTAIMYSSYNGTFTSLASDDIDGIQSLYSGGSARSKDAYDNAASNGTFATASVITVNGTSKTVQIGADLTTTTDLDYYKFTVPSGSASTATISVQSAGLSQLEPKLYVYNSSQGLITSKVVTGQYGTTLTVSISITSGSSYYVKVLSGETTAFGTGVYDLTINTGTGTTPSVTPPNTQVANGTPRVSGGGEAEVGHGGLEGNGLGVTNQSALAIRLAQFQSEQGGSVVVTPNMARSDFAFQGSTFDSPRLLEAAHAMAARPESGGNAKTDTRSETCQLG